MLGIVLLGLAVFAAFVVWTFAALEVSDVRTAFAIAALGTIGTWGMLVACLVLADAVLGVV